MALIAPSILSADFLRLGEEVRAASDAGADFVHVDVMDGHFVPNITIGPLIVEAVKKTSKLPIDVHLMITNPEKYAPDFVKAGADYLVAHAEGAVHLDRLVNHIRELGAKPGVALNPATPLCYVEGILHLIDIVVVMSVNPGFGGQSFIPYTLDKVKRLRGWIDERGLKTLIEVDGGVKPSNARAVVNAGADVLVMGSAFYHSGDYKGVVKSVREALKK